MPNKCDETLIGSAWSALTTAMISLSRRICSFKRVLVLVCGSKAASQIKNYYLVILCQLINSLVSQALATRLEGIKQKKSSWGTVTNNTFILFYSAKPRSQWWILIYWNWSIHIGRNTPCSPLQIIMIINNNNRNTLLQKSCEAKKGHQWQ